MKSILCIDPGKNGAVAVKYLNGVVTYDCPETQKEMYELINEIVHGAEQDELYAYIEKVHCMPKQGVCSVWSFACNFASWQMALISCLVPFEEVTPQQWMKKFGNLPKEKKDRKLAIKDAMQKKFPELKITLKTADALAMLSVYGE